MSALQEESREKDRQVVSLQGLIATFSSPPGSATLLDRTSNSAISTINPTTTMTMEEGNSSSTIDTSSKKWEKAVRVLQAQLSHMQATYYRQIADQPVNNSSILATSSTLSGGGSGGGSGERVGTAGSQLSLNLSLKDEIESLMNGELLGQMDALTIQNNSLTNELKVVMMIMRMIEEMYSLSLQLLLIL